MCCNDVHIVSLMRRDQLQQLKCHVCCSCDAEGLTIDWTQVRNRQEIRKFFKIKHCERSLFSADHAN